MSKSLSSLIEYEIDQSLVETAVNQYITTQAGTITKYDNKDLGMMFGKTTYGDNSWSTVHQIFQADEEDKVNMSKDYQIGLQLVKDSTYVNLINSTISFKAEVSLFKS